MPPASDHVATQYDADFTHSQIGRLQRASVWHYLEKRFAKQKNLSILELNCGTGEDALHYKFAQIFESHFKLVSKKAIGLMVPPSYLENFFRKRTDFLSSLNAAEQLLQPFSFLSAWSDHCLIDLKKNK